MSKRQSLEKPVARILGRIAILVGLLVCVAGIYISVKIAEADRYYAYRRADSDGDTILDYRDDDIDGDVVPNIEDRDADGNDEENWVQAVKAARDLVQSDRRVDWLNGAFGNLGVRMGFFRSADVVLVAYEKAGVFLSQEIEIDALGAEDAYQSVIRGDAVDVHDANALRIFFERKGWDLVTWRIAQKGDILFLGHDVVGLVVDYREGTGYVVVWADPDSHRVQEAATSQLEANGYSPSGAATIGD